MMPERLANSTTNDLASGCKEPLSFLQTDFMFEANSGTVARSELLASHFERERLNRLCQKARKGK
jgi:hypothetical protein